MRRTDCIIIGAGQAGLAMSRCLSRLGIDHVVLERGRVAQRWRGERWAALRLLTPNWMTRLPGARYAGPDPDGFMTRDETVTFLESYASGAPVEADTTVLAVERSLTGFRVLTDRDEWRSRAVVVATGHCDLPSVPATAPRLAPAYHQVVPGRYQSADDLPAGGVLVVGASATGLQLAEAIQRSGRPVTLSVGTHLRMPRRLAGRDVMWWLDRIGLLDKRTGEVADLAAARRQPSLQLVGSASRRDLDLGCLHRQGVRIVGRLLAVNGHCAYLRDDLAASIAGSELRLRGILRKIAVHSGEAVDLADPWFPVDAGPYRLDLRQSGIRSVLWATGYRRAYPWLRIPVLDRRGEIIHDGGICPVPGLYVLGLNFLRRRKSSFIDGVGRDAEELSGHLAALLGAFQRSRAA